jgi:hypothetical protein
MPAHNPNHQPDPAKLQPEMSPTETLQQPTESPDVQTWLAELQTAADRLHANLGTNMPVTSIEKLLSKAQRGQYQPEQLIAIAAAVEVEKKKRTVLTRAIP